VASLNEIQMRGEHMKTAWRVAGAGIAAALLLSLGTASGQEAAQRSGYSYIRAMSGEARVASRLNGEVEARRNMPISVGDEITVSGGGRVEIGLADGNDLFLGGGSQVNFESLSDQEGENDQFSAVRVHEGDVALVAAGSDENEIPRIDTEDATVYLSSGARVRVNSDPRRGTVVIGRAGSAEVRTRAGTYTVRAGQYLMVRGDEEAERGNGTFSRDRFDIWIADRLEATDEARVTAARYVNEDYASDVASLDEYGDWQYDSTYGGDVWAPRVDADWSPYSNGSWYYTNAGLTWWPFDPWGWFPFHYGNWYFSAGWNRWCWAPAYVYSPAWVYWGFSPGFVGWCPIGYYSFFSPWWNTYYHRWGFGPRSNLYFSLHGTFPTRRVDFRGWNFTGAGAFGTTAGRMDVIPGSRIGGRLGSQVAISSRPIVVNPREGGVRNAIRSFVQEAPRTIQRTAGPGSDRLAPVLARERTLPAETASALRERAVVAERGRLSGATAGDLAPRGAVADRSRNLGTLSPREPVSAERWRAPADRGPTTAFGRGPSPQTAERPQARAAPRQSTDESWRGRITRPGEGSQASPRAVPRSDRIEGAPPAAPRSESWRSRSEIPPARRMVDGAVPGRRAPEARPEVAPEHDWRTRDQTPASRGRDFRSEPAPSQRFDRAPGSSMAAPRGRDSRSEPAPPQRFERPPAYSMPAPRGRDFRAEPPPQRFERPPAYSAPAPRVERQPAFERPPSYSAPRAERAPSYSAPAPRPEAHHEAAPRSAPAPHGGKDRPHR
jgi:hypothetical protein